MSINNNFLIASLLLIVSCSTKNNSTINESNINDTTNQTIILVNDTPRVVIDTVAVLNDDGLCQPDEYYLTDDTNSVMTPVVFGEVVEGYEDPFVDTVSTYNDSIRFDSLMRVN